MYLAKNLIVFITVMLISGSKMYAQDLGIMTYNIRYSIKDHPKDNWDSRKETMVKLLNYYQPEVFGIQEGLIHQLEYIKTNLIDYNYIGVGRENGKDGGEFNAIFYNTRKLKILKEDTFWLSENNEVKKGWDAGYIRICTYALLETKDSKTKFWIFNTHLDHIGPIARDKSVNLILTKIKALNGNNDSLVLMGDLNDVPKSNPIQTLKSSLQDAFDVSEKPYYGPKGTYNGFNPNRIINQRIDYIFVSNLKVINYRHIDDRLDDNGFISDHLPVLITAKINP